MDVHYRTDIMDIDDFTPTTDRDDGTSTMDTDDDTPTMDTEMQKTNMHDCCLWSELRSCNDKICSRKEITVSLFCAYYALQIRKLGQVYLYPSLPSQEVL
jgi:hypothetical protein